MTTEPTTEPTKELKFCKECIFFDATQPAWMVELDCEPNEYARNAGAHCTHPAAELPEEDGSHEKFLVTGEGRIGMQKFKFCKTMRRFDCGEDAKLFSPK